MPQRLRRRGAKVGVALHRTSGVRRQCSTQTGRVDSRAIVEQSCCVGSVHLRQGAAVVALALLLATTACARARDEGPERTSTTVTPSNSALRANGPPGAQVKGAASTTSDRVAAAAAADLHDFWGQSAPQIGLDFAPLGGFIASRPGGERAPCAPNPQAVANNAFYCPTEDVIAWDAADLMPRLLERHGDLAVALVVAHEFGHAIQARLGVRVSGTAAELQADCLAGAWIGWVRDGSSTRFVPDDQGLDGARDALVEFQDRPEVAHGSEDERSTAFDRGMEGGVTACVTPGS